MTQHRRSAEANLNRAKQQFNQMPSDGADAEIVKAHSAIALAAITAAAVYALMDVADAIRETRGNNH